jgi:hypothetical protein
VLRNSTPASNQTVRDATSNPQEARRSGARLVGEAEPFETPEPLANPQTLRRRGTAAGAAFGQQTSGTNGRRDRRSPARQ